MNRRRVLAACLAAMLAAVPAVAQKPAGKGDASNTTKASREKRSRPAEHRPVVQRPDAAAELAAIRATSQAFATAFNRRDAKAVAALWTAEGDYTDEAGRTFSGQAAIEKAYASYFAENPKAHIRIVVDSLRLLSTDAAIEDGRCFVEPPPAGPPAIGQYTVVHVKVDGKWRMSTVRDRRVATPSAYGKLADLEWLIGAWTAEEHGVKSESVCRWVANKSFVERRYTITHADGKTASGLQLIGWNPERKGVQSWTFSSDGGHAVGSWTAAAGGWSAEIRGVTGEGVPTAAVNRISRLDDDAYVWQSVQRSAGGTPLPDTDEVVLKRSPAGR